MKNEGSRIDRKRFGCQVGKKEDVVLMFVAQSDLSASVVRFYPENVTEDCPACRSKLGCGMTI